MKLILIIISGVTDAFLKSDFLPNKSFPIIFDSISGSCKNIDHSFYNEDEVAATIKYVNLVLESKNVHASDIGTCSFIQLLFIASLVKLSSSIKTATQ